MMAKKKVEKQAEFSIDRWGGKMHFQCAFCSFDTFDKHDIFSHLVNAHDSEEALEQILSVEEDHNGTNNVSQNNG